MTRGFITGENALCALCLEDIETIDHLFVHCPVSKRVWQKFSRETQHHWVMPSSAKALLAMWEWTGGKEGSEIVRKMMGCAVMWSIWLARNNKNFKAEDFDVDSVWEVTKQRALWWLKSGYHNCFDMDAVSFVNNFEQAGWGATRVARQERQWKWPIVKDNSWIIQTDGSSRGSNGMAGVGVVFKDFSGDIFFILSKCIGPGDSNTAEITAIWEAINVLKEECGYSIPRIVFCSDSAVALSWVNGKTNPSWVVCRMVAEIRAWVGATPEVTFNHLFKELNSAADSLAKRGSEGSHVLSGWV